MFLKNKHALKLYFHSGYIDLCNKTSSDKNLTYKREEQCLVK